MDRSSRPDCAAAVLVRYSGTRVVGFFTVGGDNKDDLACVDAASDIEVAPRCIARSSLNKVVICWSPPARRCQYRQSRSGILSVIGIKRVHCVHDLGEIVFCLGAPGLVLDCFERGEKQANQNRDDCDDDQQLNEGEGAGLWQGDAWGEC